MARAPYDNCDGCGEDYDLRPDNTIIHLFVDSFECNHAEAICDHCMTVTRLFLEPEALIWLRSQGEFSLHLYAHGNDELRSSKRQAEGTANSTPLVEPTKVETREPTPTELSHLSFDLYLLEHDEGGSCGPAD